MEQVNTRSKEQTRELVLRLVWGAGDAKDFDNGTVAGSCFLPRPDASLVKNAKVCSRRRVMTP